MAIAPPIVAESRAAKSIGVSKPAARAADCQSAIVTPAPAVSCIAVVSMSVMASSRRNDNTTVGCPSRGRGRGTLPPTRPVLPAWGTTSAPATAHATRTADTSAVVPGRTTHVDGPEYRPVQSVS